MNNYRIILSFCLIIHNQSYKCYNNWKRFWILKDFTRFWKNRQKTVKTGFYHCPGKNRFLPAKCQPWKKSVWWWNWLHVEIKMIVIHFRPRIRHYEKGDRYREYAAGIRRSCQSDADRRGRVCLLEGHCPVLPRLESWKTFHRKHLHLRFSFFIFNSMHQGSSMSIHICVQAKSQIFGPSFPVLKSPEMTYPPPINSKFKQTGQEMR